MDLPIFDGHNDTLGKLYPYTEERLQEFFAGRAEGHLDLPRARAGGLAGGFFAVYAPPNVPGTPRVGPKVIRTEAGYQVPLAEALDPAHAARVSIAMTAGLFRLEAASAGQVKVARTVHEVARCLERGVLAAVLHLEGADAIDPGLYLLDVLYHAGLRSLGIVWSRPNLFGCGVPFRFPGSPDTGPGLTEEGRALVRACNRLGILVDVSHLNEKGFWDVAAITAAPLVATHSSAHALCPVTRNLTDRQLDAIGESGGIVGVNFDAGFVREDGMNNPDTPLSVVVRHVDYMVERMGIDHVGLGSDFDGATMPAELGDASGLPRLVAELRQAGYDEASLRKLAHENWLRVLARTWRDTQARQGTGA
ncbi:MAG TPA: membrane dipeptidase [Halothiobacillaceae bacterium]|nr:membrane dipeptidase [Halothiobacillaceae bacterium]